MTIKNSLYKIFQILLVIEFLLDGNAMYYHMSTTPHSWYWLDKILLIFSIIGLLLFQKSITVKKAKLSFTIICVLGLYLLLYILIQSTNRINALRYFIFLVIIAIWFFMDESGKRVPDILWVYSDIVTLIAAVSLVFWISCSLLHIFSPTGHVYTTWTGSSGILKRINAYFGIYYETQSINYIPFLGTRGQFIRNSAIFTEAPMASFHFCLAFLLEVLLNPKKKNQRVWLLAVAICSTISTTGFMVLIMYALYRMMFHKTKNKILTVLKYTSVPVIFLAGVIVLYVLVDQKNDTRSGDLRLDDFKACFATWMNSPILGCGIGNDYAIRQNMAYWRDSSLLGLANSLGQIFAHGGIYIALLYVGSIAVAIVKGCQKKDWDMVCFVIIFAFMFAITIMTYKFIIFLILMWMASYGLNQAVELPMVNRIKKSNFRKIRLTI